MQRVDDARPSIDDVAIDTSSLQFYITPFADLIHKTVKLTPHSNHPLFGLKITDDELLHRAYILDISPNSPCSKIFSTYKSTKRKLKGAFIISIHHHPVFTALQAQTLLQTIQNEGLYKEIEMTFAPEQKMSIKDVRKAANDYGLFAPTTKWDDSAMIAEEEEDPPFMEREAIN